MKLNKRSFTIPGYLIQTVSNSIPSDSLVACLFSMKKIVQSVNGFTLGRYAALRDHCSIESKLIHPDYQPGIQCSQLGGGAMETILSISLQARFSKFSRFEE